MLVTDDKPRKLSDLEDCGYTLARLVIEGKECDATIYPLYGQKVIIGRLSSSDLQLEDGRVSRMHAKVTVDNGVFVLEDLGSRGGTRVNGKKLDGQIHLSSGDRIQLGRVKMRFER